MQIYLSFDGDKVIEREKAYVYYSHWLLFVNFPSHSIYNKIKKYA